MADKDLFALYGDPGVVFEGLKLAVNHLIEIIGGNYSDVALQICHEINPLLNLEVAPIDRNRYKVLTVIMSVAVMVAGFFLLVMPRPTMIRWLLFCVFVIHLDLPGSRISGFASNSSSL